jgi:amidase
MKAEEICLLPLSEVSNMLRERKISSVEVTRMILERIRAIDPRLHSYLTIMEDQALNAAAKADRELAAGRWRGPLHGVPIAVKDLCHTKGVPTTCASRIYRDFRPDANATVVDRLETAGAVLVGKLNLTEFAVAWYHSDFPAPINPWDAGLWPGASSSGSGVATAAGLCFGSLGSDTGGSIRLPSASCGIVGMKPTWGRVSRHGVFALGESLDHVGPMTRRVADAALMLGVIAGYDPRDETSLAAPVENYAAAIGRNIGGLRVGIDEGYISDGATPEVVAAILEAVRVLERSGARIVKVTVPDVRPCLSSWMTLCASEAAAAHEATYPARAADYNPGMRSFLELGAKVRGQDYAKAQFARERFANRFQELFDQADAIACPTMPFASLPVSGMPPDVNGLNESNVLLRFTAPFDVSRNPTLSQPCGRAEGGPPPSLQLIGRLLGEATLLSLGAAYEAATEWHQQRPPLS